MADKASDAENSNAKFLALLGKHELEVAMCVHALVPSWHDAEDIIQEVRLQLWQEFEKFQEGSNFSAWARTIARYAVRRYVTMNQRKPLILSDDVEAMLMDKVVRVSQKQVDHRLEILVRCIRKLGSEALDLLQRCYVKKQKIKDIAAALGRSVPGTYQHMFRIRRELLDCMREHLRQEEGP